MTEARAILVTGIMNVAAVLVVAILGIVGIVVGSKHAAHSSHAQFVEDQRRTAYAAFLSTADGVRAEIASLTGAGPGVATESAQHLRSDLTSLGTSLQELRLVAGQGVYDDAVLVHKDLIDGGFAVLSQYCEATPSDGSECANLQAGDRTTMEHYEGHVGDLVIIIRDELDIPA